MKLTSQQLVEEDIFEILGLDKMPEKDQDELRMRMLDVVNNRVLLRIGDILSDEEMKEFEKVLDSNDDQKVRDFLTGKKIDISKLIVEETLVFKSELANITQK